VQALVWAPVSDCVPHERPFSFAAAPGVELVGDSVNVSVFFTPPEAAVRVTIVVAFTAVALILNAAELDPVATVTEEGTFRALLLLESVTGVWLIAGALRDTVQALVWVPLRDCVPHDRLLNVATIFGDRVIVAVCFTPLAYAVRVTFCAVFTAEAVTVNDALIVPAGMLTVVGVRNAPLLLVSVTDFLLFIAWLR
jgi:hypothetical protein